MTQVACSIIVPLFNKAELTRRCVRSVLRNTEAGTFELILIDNGSSDDTEALCAELLEGRERVPGDSDIIVARNDVNQGFAKACNQGARLATGRELLFLNNDTEVHPGWLPPLLSHLDDPGVGAVGSKLLFPNNTIQHCGVVLIRREDSPDNFVPMHWQYGTDGSAATVNTTRPFQVVTAACALIRRATFETLGGFDEGYWNGYEDVDLCLQIGELGQTVMYEPKSVVTHIESASGPERFRRTDDNVDRLMQRWNHRVVIDLHVTSDGTLEVDPDGALAGESTITATPTPSHTEAMNGAPPILREREATLDHLEQLRRREDLERTRAGRDVCWIEHEDDHEPLVTIRIATYNRGEMVVERAIRSALEQTYQNVEVLVVGDACDDATTRAIESVDDPRLRFVRLPTRGVYPDQSKFRWMVAGAHPMVTALGLARGAWLAPCDDDDELTPDHVEVLLREAKRRRLEMVWSKARCEMRVGKWGELGQEHLQPGHITHGSVLYSLGLRSFLPNSGAWRLAEPGDWNLWRRMRDAGVHMGFVDHVTYIHYVETMHREPVGAGAAS